MSPIGILVCALCVVAIGLVTVTDAKPTEKKSKPKREKKPKIPKMNLKTLTVKLLSLENRLAEMETRLERIDQVQGVFTDEPPCPIKNTDGFNKSEITGSCYLMAPSTDMMNWTDAQAYCTSKHRKSHLVAMETEQEQTYLKAKWYNQCGISSVCRFWTDGSKLGQEDWFWVTSSNTIHTGYTNWISTTTHDDERFNCLAVYSNEGYAWGDVACWAPHVVTCEIEL